MKPFYGAFIAYCVMSREHQCSSDMCMWEYGYVTDTTSSTLSVLVQEDGYIAQAFVHRSWSAVMTFAGPVRRSWDWRFI